MLRNIKVVTRYGVQNIIKEERLNVARPKKEPLHMKRQRLTLRVKEINQELDVVLGTGIPQKYMRLKKEEQRIKSKLRSVTEWENFKKYWTG